MGNGDAGSYLELGDPAPVREELRSRPNAFDSSLELRFTLAFVRGCGSIEKEQTRLLARFSQIDPERLTHIRRLPAPPEDTVTRVQQLRRLGTH